MTALEIRAANAQISMSRDVSNILDNLKDNHPTSIDWEQRRYEIAKDVLCSLFAAGKTGDVSDAVQVADVLIEALKKKD